MIDPAVCTSAARPRVCWACASVAAVRAATSAASASALGRTTTSAPLILFLLCHGGIVPDMGTDGGPVAQSGLPRDRSERRGVGIVGVQAPQLFGQQIAGAARRERRNRVCLVRPGQYQLEAVVVQVDAMAVDERDGDGGDVLAFGLLDGDGDPEPARQPARK